MDDQGAIVFISDALSDRLGLTGEVPADIAECLAPPSVVRFGDSVNRNHQSCTLFLPEAADEAEGMRSVNAHFVAMRGGSLILGCLGEFLSDADVPWEVWFGPEGVRDSSLVATELSRLRADRVQRVQRLLAGRSANSRRFRNQIQVASQIPSHVALIGNPSQAVTDLASFIHCESAKHNETIEAFVCVDASLMDAELLEAYASAAIAPLSGSAEKRSTLCLNRLDEMPVDGQDRLVQWMQTWPEQLRLVGLLSRPVIDADTDEMRPQLADAMSVFTIEVPSLASRSEDLPLLAQSLLRSARLSREASRLIESYPWTGEWDEFLAAMKFAESVVRSDRIGREHFPLAIRSYRSDRSAASEIIEAASKVRIEPARKPIEAFEIPSLDEAIKTYENELIAKAMQAADGNKAEAARRLGISRTRLLRKLDGQ